MPSKTMIIGLDCAAPQLVFDLWADQLPNLLRLRKSGQAGILKSCHPPITVPAWAVMTSGRDAGELGIYGFRNRISTDSPDLSTADAGLVRFPRLWDLMTAAGLPSIVIGVPLTWPPSAVNGVVLSGPLTPSGAKNFIQPPALAPIFKRHFPEYRFDIAGFRNLNPDELIRQVSTMTRTRFRAARYFLSKREWRFFMMVEIGLDRLQHGLWHHFMEDSAGFIPDSPYRDALRQYYILLDTEIGRLLEFADGQTDIWVVSDHGAKSFHGAFAINNWLKQNGYLSIHSTQVPLAQAMDRDLTKVWAEGGYYGRLFINRLQRPVSSAETEQWLDGIESGLNQVILPDGQLLKAEIIRPGKVFRAVNGLAPDGLLYLNDLHLRLSARFADEQLFLPENDTGPDGANHAFEGMYIVNGAQITAGLAQLDIGDITPLVLQRMDLPLPRGIQPAGALIQKGFNCLV